MSLGAPSRPHLQAGLSWSAPPSKNASISSSASRSAEALATIRMAATAQVPNASLRHVTHAQSPTCRPELIKSGQANQVHRLTVGMSQGESSQREVASVESRPHLAAEIVRGNSSNVCDAEHVHRIDITSVSHHRCDTEVANAALIGTLPVAPLGSAGELVESGHAHQSDKASIEFQEITIARISVLQEEQQSYTKEVHGSKASIAELREAMGRQEQWQEMQAALARDAQDAHVVSMARATADREQLWSQVRDLQQTVAQHPPLDRRDADGAAYLECLEAATEIRSVGRDIDCLQRELESELRVTRAMHTALQSGVARSNSCSGEEQLRQEFKATCAVQQSLLVDQIQTLHQEVKAAAHVEDMEVLRVEQQALLAEHSRSVRSEFQTALRVEALADSTAGRVALLERGLAEAQADCARRVAALEARIERGAAESSAKLQTGLADVQALFVQSAAALEERLENRVARANVELQRALETRVVAGLAEHHERLNRLESNLDAVRVDAQTSQLNSGCIGASSGHSDEVATALAGCLNRFAEMDRSLADMHASFASSGSTFQEQVHRLEADCAATRALVETAGIDMEHALADVHASVASSSAMFQEQVHRIEADCNATRSYVQTAEVDNSNGLQTSAPPGGVVDKTCFEHWTQTVLSLQAEMCDVSSVVRAMQAGNVLPSGSQSDPLSLKPKSGSTMSIYESGLRDKQENQELLEISISSNAPDYVSWTMDANQASHFRPVSSPATIVHGDSHQGCDSLSCSPSHDFCRNDDQHQEPGQAQASAQSLSALSERVDGLDCRILSLEHANRKQMSMDVPVHSSPAVSYRMEPTPVDSAQYSARSESLQSVVRSSASAADASRARARLAALLALDTMTAAVDKFTVQTVPKPSERASAVA